MYGIAYVPTYYTVLRTCPFGLPGGDPSLTPPQAPFGTALVGVGGGPGLTVKGRAVRRGLAMGVS